MTNTVFNYDAINKTQNELKRAIEKHLKSLRELDPDSNGFKGSLDDFESLFSQYDANFIEFQNYFKAPPSKDEMRAINSTIICKEVVEHYQQISQQFEQIKGSIKNDEIAHKCSDYQLQIDNFLDALEAIINAESSKIKTHFKRLDDYVADGVSKVQNSFLEEIQKVKQESEQILLKTAHEFQAFSKKMRIVSQAAVVAAFVFGLAAGVALISAF